MDFAGRDREIAIAEGGYASVVLMDILEFEQHQMG